MDWVDLRFGVPARTGQQRAFRCQPILDAVTQEVVALEVLNAARLAFDDKTEMIEADIAALECAVEVAAKTRLRVHCNMEYSTLVRAPWSIYEKLKPGIVIELVERHEIFSGSEHRSIFPWLAEAAAGIRAKGVMIAMDDVTPTTLERELIKALRPEIIKVENRDALAEICRIVNGIPIIAERIETAKHAELARALGAKEIQGYWCDRLAPAYLEARISASVRGIALAGS